jgi:hypothetical protein
VDRALWLLLWLRFFGWCRRLVRNARTVGGALLLGGGLLFFCCLCIQPLTLLLLPREVFGSGDNLEHARRFGPLFLLGYCVLNLSFSPSERAIAFTPAEVNFLFPGPFSRRQLLAYKVITAALSCLVAAVMMSAFLFRFGSGLLAGYLGLVLALLFVTLFSMAVSLVASSFEARAFNRRRKVVLLALACLAIGTLVYLSKDLVHLSATDLVDRVNESPFLRWLLLPFSWITGTFTAETIWPDLVVNGLASVAVLCVLLVLVFALDAQYLEASAVASEKIYARLQRIRAGGAAAAWRPTSGTVRFELPSLPWWGGIGPTAWRQLTTAVRSARGVLIFLFIFSAMLVVPVLSVSLGMSGKQAAAVPYVLCSMLLSLSLVSFPNMLAFDFRGDLERMDVLKTLPIAPWCLAIGQLLTPVVLLSLLQLGVLGLIEIVWGGIEWVLLFVAFLAWPLNFLSLAIDNLLFLWFPARTAPAMPGDFQAVGRQMLLMFSKMLTVMVTLGVAGGFGAGVGGMLYLASGASSETLTGPLLAGLGTAFLGLSGFAAGMVPLLARAFQRFDVTRDTAA